MLELHFVLMDYIMNAWSTTGAKKQTDTMQIGGEDCTVQLKQTVKHTQ